MRRPRSVDGMGDALATWYEARVCMLNPAARNVIGARPTRTACAMGELCRDTLFASGHAAAAAVRDTTVNASLEDVVEANTLLSGVGFESGGLAAAHGYAQGYTVLADVERNYLHGEMVAMGTLAQLMLEGDRLEAERVAVFFAGVGLPVHLGQLGVERSHDAALQAVVQGTLAFQALGNLPFPVDAKKVLAALLAADELGQTVAAAEGDAAYRRLQNGG